MDVGDLVDVSGKAEEEAGAARLVLDQRMLGLTQEQRLRGLANAAAFFADARRVDTGAEGRDVEMKKVTVHAPERRTSRHSRRRNWSQIGHRISGMSRDEGARAG